MFSQEINKKVMNIKQVLLEIAEMVDAPLHFEINMINKKEIQNTELKFTIKL
jgi:hypothetical protein